MNLGSRSTVFIEFSTWIRAIIWLFGETDPAERFLASGAIRMLTSNIIFSDGKAMNTGSVFWSHEFLWLVSVAFVDNVEYAAPRRVSQEFIHKFALFVSTEVAAFVVPFFEAKETKISEFTLRANHTVGGHVMLRYRTIAFWACFGIFLEPILRKPVLESIHLS